ncbi:FcoT family thioesterase [Streptomyces sp. HSG2]|uniref:(2E)-enoyl-ACP glycyltransferase n=1 Tax=Streptomyces sp. HSG2 TaxID=2797167 RepID=UPI0019086BE8|nr:FcoT family thioesterase [Streptomyces sp. HSG2]
MNPPSATADRADGSPGRVHPTDEELLARVLAPYKPHCEYLKSAEVTAADGLSSARCAFAIGESCYIDDTGHLNSVEINIAYNQMMYYLVAKSVKERLLTGFEEWTLDDFWRHQLPDILIARFTAGFRRPIDPRSFTGEMEFRSVTRRASGTGGPFLHARTAFRYRDAHGGRSDGEATLAFVNIA